MAQQQEQLDQCNEQLPGREHAMDHEDCMMPNGVVAGSAGDIVSESWKHNISSNIAIDFKKLSSEQQRWRSTSKQ